MADIFEELNKIKYLRKRRYFQWKNGLDSPKGYKYSTMSEEEFRKISECETDESMVNLKRWESSEEYQRLLYILKENNFDNDLIEVYDAVKKQALEGNNSAVKTMIELQKEIKSKLKKNEDDTGLDLKLKI